MKRIFKAYWELMGILYAESPFIMIATFAASALTGAAVPAAVWVNSRVFNLGLLVASGEMTFGAYTPYLVLFVVLTLLPVVIGDFFMLSYVEPRCVLIFRTAYKGKMLQKLKRLRYEHFESTDSMEIIDKAYHRAETGARMLFPRYVWGTVSALIAAAGTLYLLAAVRWWLPLLIVPPYALEMWLDQKHFYNIYDELEKFWNKERQYEILGDSLKSRDFIKENHMTGASRFLIDTYRARLGARNREYESYYFKRIRHKFTQQNITRASQLGTALALLWLYGQGALNMGLLITLTLAVFTTLFTGRQGLGALWLTALWSTYHMKFTDYYRQYFALSEDTYGALETLPDDCTIEFNNVHFKYPGTEKEILSGLSLTVAHGEKVSIVGQNGEGKTTMIKLLLGLFQPDSGEIRIGGKPLTSYSQAVRTRLFGPVFQDFVKYSVTLAENVGIGDVDKIGDENAVSAAMHKAKVDAFLETLPNGADTLLGRDFEGGVDLSGGQWQRVAIARAFMGDKPILILDEPTSQLDPMAESRIYSEFAELAAGKTALFITHRLGSTMITDKIYVIANGRVAQSGSHGELMREGGLYADMFNAQKQWYIKSGEEVSAHA